MAKKVKVILLEDVKNLGKRFTIADVAPIFARNVLLPQGIAQLANTHAMNELSAKMKKYDSQKTEKAENLKGLIESLQKNGGLTFKKQTTDEGHLYDKIDLKVIIEEISNQYGIKLEKSELTLDNKINTIGTFEFKVMDKSIPLIVEMIETPKAKKETVKKEKAAPKKEAVKKTTKK